MPVSRQELRKIKEMRIEKPARIAPRGTLSLKGRVAAARDHFFSLARLRAAPRMSPSDAPESDEPY